MEITDATRSLMELQMALVNTTDPDDRSSTNLETITTIFEEVAENDSLLVNNDTLETATMILSQIVDWGDNETTRNVLQNRSAE